MAEGVTFTDGEQVSARSTSSDTTPKSIGSSGGPLITDTDTGRSSDVVVGNNESMPTRGDILDCPASY